MTLQSEVNCHFVTSNMGMKSPCNFRSLDLSFSMCGHCKTYRDTGSHQTTPKTDIGRDADRVRVRIRVSVMVMVSIIVTV